jgi:BirA family transcriptional regulator, biotin operon repressor / biotin---[acetyl-CoA-carboxylase] ligase
VRDQEAADRLGAKLDTERLGRPLRFYPVAVTTEALALGWARAEGAAEGATVVARQELSGRGRKGPPWTPFPDGGLYFSTVLRPGLPPDGEGLLWLLASLAAADGVAAVSGLEVDMKWPDDILVGGRKIGGVKVSAQLGPGEIASAVVSCRINVGVEESEIPEPLREIATSIRIESGDSPDHSVVLAAILGALERCYDLDVPRLLEDYSARCRTLGQSVRALLLPRGEVMGTATAIDHFGSLVIDVGGRSQVVPVDVLKRLERLN